MDLTWYEKQKLKQQQIVDNMSLEELQWALGRYCGPSNIILCEKKYGCVLSKELVQQAIDNRAFEDAFGLQSK